MKEIDAIMTAEPDIIALDATNRKRPDGSTIETFFPEVRKKYQDMIFMADCASYEDGMRAQKLGFDILEPHFVVIRRIPKVQKFRAFQC